MQRGLANNAILSLGSNYRTEMTKVSLMKRGQICKKKLPLNKLRFRMAA